MKTDKIDLSKLAKILGKLGSDSDQEVQVAIKQALAMLNNGFVLRMERHRARDVRPGLEQGQGRRAEECEAALPRRNST